MKALKNNRPVIVGVFIALGLAIFIITIFTLGGQKKTFVKTFLINAVFDDVDGLMEGGNVRFSGVKIGTIKDISFYGDSQVKVIMSIEKNAESHIHKNAFAKISTDGLIGNKIIVIYGGDVSKPQVEKEDFLAVEKAGSTDDMMATLQANNKNLLAITTDFKSISKKIDSGHGALATLLNDPNIAKKINATVDNLQTTVANLNTASVSGKDVLANFQDFSGKLTKRGNSVNDLVADTAMYRNLRNTTAQLQTAAHSIASFAANLKKTSNQLNQKDNPVGVLLNDSTAATSLKATLKNLETSSKKLDEDLEAIQHNFLLRGFFRKKEEAQKEQPPRQ